MRPKLLLGLGAAICAAAAPSLALAHHGDGDQKPGARHVLLISVDGLHASDLQTWIDANSGSTLASLSARGTTYSNARATFPSDSFPGMLALATGGTSKSTGVYYDDSFDRSLYPPSDTTCSGPVGTEVIYAEPADVNPDALNGGVSSHQAASLDPTQLPRQKTATGCEPVYPNQFLRVNSIFSVIHAAGLRTAWSDKHPAYQLLNGHGTPNAIDDLFTPEVNSKAPAGSPGPVGGDNTSSEARIQAYDAPKVQAVVDEIGGKSSYCVDEPAKCSSPGVPAIMGMNFQAVSVGQKLPNAGSPLAADGRPFIGGYALDGSFNPNLQSAMQFVDSSLGKMVDALKAGHLLDSTEIIISAKHGQSPTDPAKLHRVNPDDINALVTSSTGANFPDPVTGLGQQASTVTDDVALLWLSTPFQSKSPDMVSALGDPANVQQFDIKTVISGRRLQRMFGDPATDPRVPDAILQPNEGGLYSLSKKKVAEHGGGAPGDRHVALLVVAPGDHGADTISARVQTKQVAPTILSFLGLDPQALDAVRAEHTLVLPGQHG
jgi:hypothetical protein